MAIPAKQIGWSNESNLLWNISKQLEYLIQVTNNANATVTAYSQSLTFPINYVSMTTLCNGSPVGNYIYTNQTVNNINELVTLYNNTVNTKLLGIYSALGTDVLVLNTTTAIKNALCPTGTLTLSVFND